VQFFEMRTAMTIGLRRRMAAIALTLCFAMAAPALADGVTDGNAGREALLAGNADEAIRLFSRAIAFGGLNAKNQAVTLNLRGNAYLARGQTQVALDDVNESLRLAETVDAHFTRAKIFIAQYRFDDAVEDLGRAIALGGEAADIYALRGHAHLYAGRMDEAFKDLDHALKLQPNYAFALRTRGHAFMNSGKDDKAIADLTQAIALDPKDSEAYWLRAYAWRYRKKQPLKAIADYSAAIAANPSDSTNRTARADAYEELGRYAEASADYDEWIRQNPRGPFGYWARGRLNLVQGRYPQAAADLAKAVGLKPADAYNVLWLHLARAKAGTDDAAELQANAGKVNRTIWPGPLIDYLTGKLGAPAVLAKTDAAEGKAKAKASQACEAQMFLGQDDLAKGRKAQGIDRLQAAARACSGDSAEGRLIKADLQRNGAAAPRPTLAAAAPPTNIARPAALPAQAARPKPPARQAQAQGGDLLLRGSLK
jgi:tetratricopeptide (TPR) repeat protein